MKRREFLKTITAGAAVAGLGQTGCTTPGSQSDAKCKNKPRASKKSKPYRDRTWSELFLPYERKSVTELDPDSISLIRGADKAERGGGYDEPWSFNGKDGWTHAGLSLSWIVNSPKAFDCSFALTYSCEPGSEGSEYEILTEKYGYVGYDSYGRKTTGRVTGMIRQTCGWLTGWRNFERDEVTGTLRIPAGLSVITLRATKKTEKSRAVMTFHSFEIIPESIKPSLASARERALNLRSNTDWFVDAKYGMMFHYSPTVFPRHGPRKAFDQAVRDFNVKRFVEMLKEAGAGYVFFFVSHGLYWFPAPIRTVEEILPGRTCDRDLIGDLAEALEPEGIRLLLYYNPSYYDDVDWARANGWGPDAFKGGLKEATAFYSNQCRILEEVGKRYGRSIWGYWFDNGHPHQLFERQAHACKVGNPDLIIGYNTGAPYPKVTEFQDFYPGEFGSTPVVPPDCFWDGPQAGLQRHGSIFIDGAWHHFLPDTEIGPQRFDTDVLINYVRTCISRKTVLTINLCMYQDGTVSPATLEQMKSVRKAIRGA